jgi:hypothetical protein
MCIIGKAIEHVVYEISARFQFLFYTNLHKLQKHIESLVYSWNSQNYIGWVLFGRAAIEL